MASSTTRAQSEVEPVTCTSSSPYSQRMKAEATKEYNTPAAAKRRAALKSTRKNATSKSSPAGSPAAAVAATDATTGSIASRLLKRKYGTMSTEEEDASTIEEVTTPHEVKKLRSSATRANVKQKEEGKAIAVASTSTIATCVGASDKGDTSSIEEEKEEEVSTICKQSSKRKRDEDAPINQEEDKPCGVKKLRSYASGAQVTEKEDDSDKIKDLSPASTGTATATNATITTTAATTSTATTGTRDSVIVPDIHKKEERKGEEEDSMGERDKKEETKRRKVRFAVGEKEKKEETKRRVFVLGEKDKKEEITGRSDIRSFAPSSSSQLLKTSQASTSRTTLSDDNDCKIWDPFSPPDDYNTDDDLDSQVSGDFNTDDDSDDSDPDDFDDSDLDDFDDSDPDDFDDSDLDDFDDSDLDDSDSDQGSTPPSSPGPASPSNAPNSTSKYCFAKVVDTTSDDDIVEEIQSEAVQREQEGLPPLYENRTFFREIRTFHANSFKST